MRLDIEDGIIAYDVTMVAGSALPPVLFLHGALGVRGDLAAVQEKFTDRSRVAVDFPSHGESSVRRTSLNCTALARDTLALMDALRIDQADVVGHSMGGYIGLQMAQMAPKRVRSVVTLGTKFYWTAEAIDMTLRELDADMLRTALPRYFDALSAAHQDVHLTLKLMQSLISDFRHTQLDVSAVRAAEVPILICTGDRDSFVPPSEMARLYEALDSKRNAMAVLPNTPHPLQHLAVECFEQAVRRFWQRTFHDRMAARPALTSSADPSER